MQTKTLFITMFNFLLCYTCFMQVYAIKNQIFIRKNLSLFFNKSHSEVYHVDFFQFRAAEVIKIFIKKCDTDTGQNCAKR